MKKNTPPKSVFQRSSRLLGLAAGVAGKELASRAKSAFARGDEIARKLTQLKTQMDQARAIVDALGSLKGAAMKVGQLITVELRDYLPPEVIEILRQLQDRAIQVEWSEMEKVLRKELGAEKFARLENLEPVALAAASIGQVHRARIRDAQGNAREIVLKIQYPGIADTIESDCALLEKIANGLLSVSFKNVDFSDTIEEVKNVLVQETDYRREAANMTKARLLARDIPGVIVPEVISEFSTGTVLAMTYEPGETLESWLQSKPSHEDRQYYAKLFLDIYFKEFFTWGFVQTDPNFANFLIRKGTRELVLLDFGAAKEYSLEFRKTYADLTRANDRDEREKVMELCYELGFFDRREEAEAQEMFYRLIRGVHRIFRKEHQPCDFSDQTYLDETRDHVIAMIRKLKYSAPPRQIIFLHRKLGGVYQIAKAMGAVVDLRPYLEGIPV